MYDARSPIASPPFHAEFSAPDARLVNAVWRTSFLPLKYVRVSDFTININTIQATECCCRTYRKYGGNALDEAWRFVPTPT